MSQDFCVDVAPLYLRLFGDACGPLVGQPFCAGAGGSTPCPCGNSSPLPNLEGCRNSVNGVNGGRLEVLGTASLSADSVLLRALRLPATTSALFFQGTQQQASGAGIAFGDGLRCAGGVTTRLASRSAVNGQVEFPLSGEPAVSNLGGISTAGTRTYQVWYRNSASFCTSSMFNLTNGWELAWMP
ncbi:MAG: hypothetical protein NTY35_08505 [Planctomycetota bacterium]|nr:hypothetical protein [Planctomycetota bacterium]